MSSVAKDVAMSSIEEHFRTMARIRAFEERVAHHFRAGDVHGFVHVSIGQEAVASGTCSVLRADDYITTTHRGHGHCLAKGADPVAMMAELFGRATGLCGGKGGSMHLADPRLGILGANGIVGAGVPIAVGAALSAQIRRDGRVAVAFFGEGAVHTGAFHEALTLAVVWQLPVVFVCESNGWAEFTPTDAWAGPTPTARGALYGMPALTVDGGDVVEVERAVTAAVEDARGGAGPTFIEAQTVRGHGHYEGDAQPYRSEEDAAWQNRDPLVRTQAEHGFDQDKAAVLRQAAEEEMAAAVEQALAAPYPDVSTVLEDVYG
jgi:TPP-dependent pyruvate/acetoin dehydrogenase alpha subunit